MMGKMSPDPIQKTDKTMKTKMHILFFGLAIALLLAACQSASSATPAASGLGGPGGGQFAQNPDFQTRIASDPDMQTRIASGGGPGGFGGQGGFGNQRATPTPTAEPIPTGTPEPTPTAVSQTAGAEKAAQDYFAALQKGDFDAASRLVSTFSLTASKLTAGDAAAALTQQKAQGAKWSNLQVKDSHGNWHDVDCDPGTLVVNCGDMLQECTQGFYRSTTHQVCNPPLEQQRTSRLSMPLFLHPRADVRLSDRYTAQSYLNERLEELGLVSRK